MGAHHYECVYVLSDASVLWMTYYTHYKYKGAHHYVCVDVLSVCCVDWKPYDTLHMNIDAHPYEYQKNLCIHHVVREVVHLKYPGKKSRS
jgi:hypothetical protein